jgi:hypothetical protein
LSDSEERLVDFEVVETHNFFSSPEALEELRRGLQPETERMKGMISVTTRSPEFLAQMKEREHRRKTFSGWSVIHGAKSGIWTRINDGAWRGQRCFLIGGGPSLSGFDFSLLKGEHVIAINRAFENCPDAEFFFSMDNRLYRWIVNGDISQETTRKWREFKGIKVFVDILNYPYGKDVNYVYALGSEGYPSSLQTGIYHSNNSGYGALQIALLLRASPIYLLGYDMNDNGRTHYHTGYPMRISLSRMGSFREGFRRLAPLIKQKGTSEVFNLNPASGLRCFPFADMKGVFHAHDERPEIPESQKTDSSNAGL